MSEADIFVSDVGTWDADVIVRVAPGAPEQRSKGVAVTRLVGGWLISDFKNESGFDGHGVCGWDATRKTYVATWVDPMRTFLVVMTGAWDAQARTLTFAAEAKLPDGRELRWVEITERPDDDTRVFHQRFGDHEMMTVTYSRRRA